VRGTYEEEFVSVKISALPAGKGEKPPPNWAVNKTTTTAVGIQPTLGKGT